MKAGNNDEKIVRYTVRLPKSVYDILEKSAIENRRSINDEIIIVTKGYFSAQFVNWEPWIKKAIETYAEKRDSTYSWAANDLISQKISDFDMVDGGIKNEIEKELEQEKSKKAAG